jgi:hypothetical protein
MAQPITRKTVRAEREFRIAQIEFIGDTVRGQPTNNTNDDLSNQLFNVSNALSGVAEGLFQCAGALRDIYDCVSRIEANQKKGAPGAVGGGRFPSAP